MEAVKRRLSIRLSLIRRLHGPEVIKPFSCSTQLSIKTFFMLNSAEHKIFSTNKYENANNSWHFHIY